MRRHYGGDVDLQRYGSEGSRSSIQISTESGAQLRHEGKDPPINIRVTIPANFASANAPNVQPLPAISGSAVSVTLSPPIRLDSARKWQIVPYLISIPYTTPNLGPSAANVPGFPLGNSRFTLQFGSGSAAVDLVLPAGLYGIDDIAQALNNYAQTAGWIADAVAGPAFSVTGIAATQQVIITVSPANFLANVLSTGNIVSTFPTGGVIMTFTNPSAVSGLNDINGQMIGFPTTGGGATLTCGSGGGTAAVSFTSPVKADLARLSAYIVYTDIATASYIDGASSNAIFTVPVGDKIPNTIVAIQPSFEQPVPVGQFTISSFRIWLTDQMGNYIPAFSDDAIIAFSIEEPH